MRNAIDEYRAEVLSFASLDRVDGFRIRAELKDHLEEVAAVARHTSFTREETLAMFNREFGKPETLGKAIAGAKGRFRTYLKKQKWRLPIALVIALVVAFPIRWGVAEEFYAATNAIAPSVPKGSRMLIYKLGTTYHTGDVIVFRPPAGTALLGVVTDASADSGTLTVSRNGEPDQKVPSRKVVGRVVLNTR